MGDLFSNLGLGFGVVFQLVDWTPAFLGGASIPIPVNILLCLIGALVGTLVGVLPGIGTIATVAMLLPITFGLPPVGALIMLAGIYYGAQYGGSTTSILVNIPELAAGLGFATVAMGLFGFAEIIRNLVSGCEADRELVQQ